MEWKDINTIRRHNLRIIVARAGGLGPFSEILGVSKQRVSQLICAKPVQNVGDEFARRVEKACGYAENWIDNWHEEEYSVIAHGLLIAERYLKTSQNVNIGRMLRELSDESERRRLESSGEHRQNTELQKDEQGPGGRFVNPTISISQARARPKRRNDRGS